MFEFEWDEAKRLSNLEKHGFDFKDADQIFDGRPRLNLMSAQAGEVRLITVAMLDSDYVSVVWTIRGAKIRLISMRSARRAERRQYRQLHG